MNISNQIQECPYCGCEEYYIKQNFKGNCRYNLRFDGKEADNSEMWENTEFRYTSKYAWCKECNKKLFKINE